MGLAQGGAQAASARQRQATTALAKSRSREELPPITDIACGGGSRDAAGEVVEQCSRPATQVVVDIDVVVGLDYQYLCNQHAAGAQRRAEKPLLTRNGHYEAPPGLAEAARELARAKEEMQFQALHDLLNHTQSEEARRKRYVTLEWVERCHNQVITTMLSKSI